MTGGVSSSYQYNGYSSYQPNMLDSQSWADKAKQDAENIKNSTSSKTDKTSSSSSTSSTSSSSSSINVGSTASTSSFLLAYQSQLEDLEAASSKLQMSTKDNLFSKYDEAVQKAAKEPSEKNTEAVNKALDNIVSAFKDLANKYNNTMSFLTNNVERGSGISAQKDAFNRMMPHEKTLSAMGMGYDKNGKITFNEDAFRENWEKDSEQVKNLMGGQFGVAERVGSKATAILDSSVDKIIGSDGSATGSKNHTGSSTDTNTTTSFTKSSQMSDSFMQFANFARSGAFNLSNYYTVSMLNMLV